MRIIPLKSFALFTTLSLLSLQLLAQITITKDDMMIVGTDIDMYLDTNSPSLNFMDTATNQNWDFTTVVSDTVIQSDILNPAGQAKSNLFPTATAALHRFDFNTQYYDNSANEVIYLGTVITVLDTQVYHHNYKNLEYPSTLNSQFTDVGDRNKGLVSPIGFDPDGTGPHPFVDSITDFSRQYFESNIDAYGLVKTPIGEYNSLRQYNTTTFEDSAFMSVNGKWEPMSSTLANFLMKPLAKIDTTYAYSWIAKGWSLPVCTIEYDPSNNNKILTVQWTDIVPTGIADNDVKLPFEFFPNPVNDVLHLKNLDPESMLFSIYSQEGEEVIFGVVKNSFEVKMDHLSPGIYFLHLENSKGEIEVRRIVKK